jgi:hypothetical protein
VLYFLLDIENTMSVEYNPEYGKSMSAVTVVKIRNLDPLVWLLLRCLLIRYDYHMEGNKLESLFNNS